MASSASAQSNKLRVKTSLGDFTIELFDDTPLHRDNFLRLANEGYYDGLLFHRVINGFMVQAGDPNSRNARPGQLLGDGDPGYEIDAEILPNHHNVRGALAAARTSDFVNPQRRSSGSQFYIVSGTNGAPHLDGAYTVFGQVTDGLDVIDLIQKVATDRNDRPLDDIRIIDIKPVE